MKARSDFSLIAIDNMQEMQNFLKDFYAEVKALNLGQGYTFSIPNRIVC